MKIKVDDIVEVIAGNDRGAQGKVLSVNHQTGKVVVEGVHRVYKHMRKSNRNPQGGRLSKEMPLESSNVMVICQKCSKPTRVGLRYAKDGTKERFCRKCGGSFGDISPPRKAYAKA